MSGDSTSSIIAFPASTLQYNDKLTVFDLGARGTDGRTDGHRPASLNASSHFGGGQRRNNVI